MAKPKTKAEWIKRCEGLEARHCHLENVLSNYRVLLEKAEAKYQKMRKKATKAMVIVRSSEDDKVHRIEKLELELFRLKALMASSPKYHFARAERVISPPVILTERADAIRAAAVKTMRAAYRPIIGRLCWRTDDVA